MTAEDLQVCRELDELTLRMFELMEEQMRNNAKIAVTMKRGFIDIAKARYIMGNRSLSTLQLPSTNSPEFTAQSTVKREAKDNVEHPTFVLNTVSKTKPKEKVAKNEDLQTLRKRTVDDKSTQLRDDIPKETPEIKESIEEREPVNVVDPIKWFGLLVPQNLRLAQTGFSSSLQLVTQSVNIQLEIDSTRNRYNELREKKTCSQVEVVENKLNNGTSNPKSKSKKKNSTTGN